MCKSIDNHVSMALEAMTSDKLKRETAKDLAIILGILMKEHRWLNRPWWKRWFS